MVLDQVDSGCRWVDPPSFCGEFRSVGGNVRGELRWLTALL